MLHLNILTNLQWASSRSLLLSSCSCFMPSKAESFLPTNLIKITLALTRMEIICIYLWVCNNATISQQWVMPLKVGLGILCSICVENIKSILQSTSLLLFYQNTLMKFVMKRVCICKLQLTDWMITMFQIIHGIINKLWKLC